MKAYLYLTMLVIAATIAVLWGKGCFKNKQPPPIVQHVTAYDSVKHYRDRLNIVHAQLELEIGDRLSMLQAHQGEVDSLCRRLHLRENQLKDMAQVVTQTTGNFSAPLHDTVIVQAAAAVDGEPPLIESIQAKTFDWHDDYLAVSGVIFADSLEVNYSMGLTFRTTTFWRRKHKFLGLPWGRKIFYMDAYCDNPNVSITGLKAIKINN